MLVLTTGYWFLDHADEHKHKEWQAPPDLVQFIEAAHARGQKVVYMWVGRFEISTDISGFGSIVVSDPQEMTRCVVEAVVRSGVCAVLSKGWSDRGKRKGEPPEMSSAEGADGIKYPDSI